MATQTPQTVWEQSAEYENAQVGDTIHYFDGWRGHEGTVALISPWTESEYDWDFWGAPVSERLAVVALTQTVDDGGYAIVRLRRYTSEESWAQGREICSLGDVIASTGIRWGTGDITADAMKLIARHMGQVAADISFDHAIAECEMEDDPHGR